MPRANSREKVLELIPETWRGYPILSYSQLMQADRCKFAWYLSYVMEDHSPVKSKALSTGSFVHAGLNVLYTDIMRYGVDMSYSDWAGDKIPELVMTWMEESEDQFADLVSIQNASAMLNRYVLQGRAGVLGAHDPVGSEEHFVALCETPSGRKFTLQGYVDLITMDEKGRTWIWDHKTGTKFWSPINIIMDSQLPTYQILMQNDGIPVSGLCINQLNSYQYAKPEEKTNDDLFRREFTYRSAVELANIKAEFMQMAEELLSVMAGELPARRSLRKDCDRCGFTDLCLNMLKGMDHDAAAEVWIDTKVNRIKPNYDFTEGIILDEV